MSGTAGGASPVLAISDGFGGRVEGPKGEPTEGWGGSFTGFSGGDRSEGSPRVCSLGPVNGDLVRGPSGGGGWLVEEGAVAALDRSGSDVCEELGVAWGGGTRRDGLLKACWSTVFML